MDYIMKHSKKEIVLKNYKNHLFYYRNPGAKLELQPEGVRDENRVIV